MTFETVQAEQRASPEAAGHGEREASRRRWGPQVQGAGRQRTAAAQVSDRAWAFTV